MADHAERYFARARRAVAPARDRQGRAAGFEIPHRPSAVADRVWRLGGRIRDAAEFGTSTFFLLSLMAMVDFFGGIALSARRPAAVSASRRGRREVEAPVREPQVEPANPAPAPSASPAAGVADSVLQDHPTPKATANAGEPSPTIPSPELQPGAGQSASPDAPPR